ncbi:heat shock protein HtpX [Candidatus Halobonum tyrrellensis G22]|uniref:Protease HtpX homolog n=2 Tax=Candidatus Halobonum TaxID=1431544 RepID=V4HAQ6_9EURY|nr:heat shock protein HtpX [Candidatus Halobonum tyrrellensis G22]
MAGVVVLLAALYVGFAAALAQYFGEVAAVAVAVGALSVGQLLYGHEVALRSVGGEVVSESEYPDLHARVGRLAQQAGVRKPDVAVADEPMPNAFAAGRSESTAVVCVTTGLLDTVDGAELDGVLAHELAHVQHRDVVVMTLASAVSMAAFWVVRWGWIFDDGGGGGGGENGQPQFLVAFAASLVVWVASSLVIRLLSRYREYAADRGAVAITGEPAALATALAAIDGRMERVPDDDLREHEGTSALMFCGVEAGKLTRWFGTHPAVDERIERLRALEAEMASA